MRLQRQLQEEGRTATEQERAVLAGWTGWGAPPHVFDPASPQHRAVAESYAELQTLLTPSELDAAKRSTQEALRKLAPLAADLVVMGGQAVHFWTGRYMERVPTWSTGRDPLR